MIAESVRDAWSIRPNEVIQISASAVIANHEASFFIMTFIIQNYTQNVFIPMFKPGIVVR